MTVLSFDPFKSLIFLIVHPKPFLVCTFCVLLYRWKNVRFNLKLIENTNVAWNEYNIETPTGDFHRLKNRKYKVVLIETWNICIFNFILTMYWRLIEIIKLGFFLFVFLLFNPTFLMGRPKISKSVRYRKMPKGIMFYN